MVKVIVIGTLITVLIYLIIRRFSTFTSSSSASVIKRSTTLIEIGVPLSLLKSALKKTMFTVGMGIALLMVIIVLTAKFKIALIMLPISLYLIGQFFLLNNHIKTIKSQHITYDSNTHVVSVERIRSDSFTFNLLSEVKSVKEATSVQKNNGILLGYYEIKTVHSNTLIIPYLVQQNLQTKPFFDKLHLFNRESETKLFPII